MRKLSGKFHFFLRFCTRKRSKTYTSLLTNIEMQLLAFQFKFCLSPECDFTNNVRYLYLMYCSCQYCGERRRDGIGTYLKTEGIFYEITQLKPKNNFANLSYQFTSLTTYLLSSKYTVQYTILNTAKQLGNTILEISTILLIFTLVPNFSA